MTDQPAVGPLRAEDVKLLVKGDLLQWRGTNDAIVEFFHSNLMGVQVVEPHSGARWTVSHETLTFIGRPDSEGWISGRPPKEITDMEVSLQGSGTRDSGDMKWRPIRLAPTAQVETLGPAAALAADVVRDEPLDVLLKRAVEAFKALSPEEQQRQFDEQKRRWVAAEMAIGDEGTRCIPPTQPNTGGAEVLTEVNGFPVVGDPKGWRVDGCTFHATEEGLYYTVTDTGGEVEASGADFEPDHEVTEDAVAKILAPYLPLINSTPDLLSILYDADLMPEQTVTVRGAICVAAVCEAHKAALRTTPVPSVDLAELKRLVQEIADGMPRVRAVHRITHARANALQALALITQIERGEG